ncbi:MAG: hypothetical protein ABI867_16265 [Kofleriaceae bacterium]
MKKRKLEKCSKPAIQTLTRAQLEQTQGGHAQGEAGFLAIQPTEVTTG